MHFLLAQHSKQVAIAQRIARSLLNLTLSAVPIIDLFQFSVSRCSARNEYKPVHQALGASQVRRDPLGQGRLGESPKETKTSPPRPRTNNNRSAAGADSIKFQRS